MNVYSLKKISFDFSVDQFLCWKVLWGDSYDILLTVLFHLLK